MCVCATYGAVVERGGERGGVQQVEAGDGGGRVAAPLGARGPPPHAARARAALVARASVAACEHPISVSNATANVNAIS